MDNYPDDWGCYWLACDRCGHRYHASEGYCDRCVAVCRCGEELGEDADEHSVCPSCGRMGARA